MDNLYIGLKLMKTLEFFLSLHEADEIFNMILNDNVKVEELEQRLQQFRDGSSEEV